ncbi:MAG: dTDP-4-dehydrorhamnose 3,5-epimerase family protein, partial [Lysobacterales bacterium]
MRLIETGLPGLVIIEPQVHGDERGYFRELWQASRYSAAGMPGLFLQSNISRSAAGVLRG